MAKSGERWGISGGKWGKVAKSDEKWLKVGKVEKSGGTW